MIDIHFNPQLTVCHPIFTSETRKRAIEYLADNESGQQGTEKERNTEREKRKMRERHLIPQTGGHIERNCRRQESLDYLGFQAVCRR